MESIGVFVGSVTGVLGLLFCFQLLMAEQRDGKMIAVMIGVSLLAFFVAFGGPMGKN